MISTRLKTSWKIETAAPAGEVDRLRRVLLDVLAFDVRGEVLALLADVDPLEVMRVEPELEAVDVAARTPSAEPVRPRS